MRWTLRDISDLVPGAVDRLAGLSELTLQRRRGPSSASMVGIGLLGVGLGAALMYLFDPRAGHERRAAARAAMTTFAQRSSAAVDEASRDVAARARTLATDLRSRVGGAVTATEADRGAVRPQRS